MAWCGQAPVIKRRPSSEHVLLTIRAGKHRRIMGRHYSTLEEPIVRVSARNWPLDRALAARDDACAQRAFALRHVVNAVVRRHSHRLPVLAPMTRLEFPL